MLTPQVLCKYLISRQAPNLLFVRFSLDAGGKDRYSKNYEQVKTNIEMALKIRAKSGLTAGVGVSYLVAGPAQADARAAIGWAAELGVDFIQFKPASLSVSGGLGKRYFPAKELQAAEATLQQLQQEREWGAGVIISRFTALLETTYTRCYGQQWSAVLGADGKLYICCENKYKSHFVLGDLHQQTFEEIWTSERRAQVVDCLKPAQTCFPGCKMHEINISLAEMRAQAASREELIAAVNARHAELLQMSNGQILAGVNFV